MIQTIIDEMGKRKLQLSDIGCRSVDANGEEHDGVTLQSIINKIPTTDAIPVVRCKDCKHRLHYIDSFGNEVYKCEVEIDLCDPYEVGRKPYEDDWFCADGEKEEEK